MHVVGALIMVLWDPNVICPMTNVFIFISFKAANNTFGMKLL